jgi:hypothetical protein
MRKGIIAIVIVAILMASLFWYFTQETTEQIVTVKEDWTVQANQNCGVGVILRADLDRTEVILYGDVKITHPDGDVDENDDGGTFLDDFCGGDWVIEITPTKYDLPEGGQQNVDGEVYTHTISVPDGQFVFLTFIFEWTS